MDELGILSYVQEWAGKVQVINPLNGTDYDREDADQFIELLGVAVSNAKVIGIDEGATFVNNYISQECYAVVGMMVIGGEMNEGLSYNVVVPTYLVDPTLTALDYSNKRKDDFYGLSFTNLAIFICLAELKFKTKEKWFVIISILPNF